MTGTVDHFQDQIEALKTVLTRALSNIIGPENGLLCGSSSAGPGVAAFETTRIDDRLEENGNSAQRAGESWTM